MVWIAFGFSHVQKFFSTFLMFYFVSFVTGGGMLAVHYLLQRSVSPPTRGIHHQF